MVEKTLHILVVSKKFYKSFLGSIFFLYFSFMKESKRQVAMTILSFIVVLCHVGSAKTTLMHVGHYGRKNFTQFGNFEEIPQIFPWVHLFFFFSFYFPFLIESKSQIAITRLSFIVISCCVGCTKTTVMRVGHYGGKNFTHFGCFGEILQIFPWVCLFCFVFFF